MIEALLPDTFLSAPGTCAGWKLTRLEVIECYLAAQASFASAVSSGQM